MKVSVEAAVRAGRPLMRAARAWRFRAAEAPDRAPGWPEGPVLFAGWHEHLLPLALLGRGRGIAALVSRNRDGEIISRLVAPLGLVTARGSTSRGGEGGSRALLRAARSGRSIFITPDGPRGPRRECKPGIVRVARLTNLRIVPIAVSSASAVRVSSWDRFYLPAPGAKVFVAFGTPIRVPRGDGEEDDIARARRVGEEIDRTARRAAAAAAEARRWGRPLPARRAADDAREAAFRAVNAGGSRPGAARLEGRVRRAWREDRPALWLRAGAAAYGAVRGVRDRLYERGLLTAFGAPIPVVSVGGVTVGGSGKTPLASAVAGILGEAGHAVAMLTRGYPDEMLLHADLRPGVRVWGHPDRVRLAYRAAAAGATAAVLDDGLQHRRLARDLEILALDRDALRRTNRRLLPAGPFREPPDAAIRRSDVVVLIGREPPAAEIETFDDEWLARLPARCVGTSAFIEADDPVHVAGPPGLPSVALTGVMKPNLFFALARSRASGIGRDHALPDHGLPTRRVWRSLLDDAREGGLLMTRKDYMRLSPILPSDLSVWVLPERIVWRRGREELARRVLEAVAR